VRAAIADARFARDAFAREREARLKAERRLEREATQRAKSEALLLDAHAQLQLFKVCCVLQCVAVCGRVLPCV